MTSDLGKINAVKDMISTIKAQCQTYQVCTEKIGITNETMENLDKYLKQLEEELSRLEKT